MRISRRSLPRAVLNFLIRVLLHTSVAPLQFAGSHTHKLKSENELQETAQNLLKFRLGRVFH